eukprot:scaffold3319_cov427-Prasinococcus_capsulatus_cf.AAC.20
MQQYSRGSAPKCSNTFQRCEEDTNRAYLKARALNQGLRIASDRVLAMREVGTLSYVGSRHKRARCMVQVHERFVLLRIRALAGQQAVALVKASGSTGRPSACTGTRPKRVAKQGKDQQPEARESSGQKLADREQPTVQSHSGERATSLVFVPGSARAAPPAARRR